MSLTKDTRFVLSISILLLVFVILPYVIAFRVGGNDYVFNGFLLNPLDGNSYLAKMYQGWEGSWRYKLAFSPEPGKGAYLFLFYLGLGHLARVFGTSLVFMFHLARFLGCIFLLWTLWKYYTAVLPTPRSHKFAFAAAALGSGMGWLLIPTGAFPSDFWVAETYPFLSSYANPHFPIGLSLAIWLIMPPLDRMIDWKRSALIAAIALTLSVVNPFGIVLVGFLLIGTGLWYIFQKEPRVSPVLFRGSVIGLFGLPLLIYYFWVANTDPTFSVWNTQNLTPSPPLWDLLISLSPALIFGVLGVWNFLKPKSRKLSSSFTSLGIWVIMGLLALYLPVGLQRRFMMGLYIPVVGLAALGIEKLSGEFPRRYRILITCFFLLALPTNLIILLAGQGGIQSHDPKLYLTREEMDALVWIKGNVGDDALILSGPDMGLFIPAYTGRRVIYGHPFETMDAINAEIIVLNFYRGKYTQEQVNDLLLNYNVDYIMLGPRERALGSTQVDSDWSIEYFQDAIVIYQPSYP